MAQTLLVPWLRRVFAMPPDIDLEVFVRESRIVLRNVQLHRRLVSEVVGTSIFAEMLPPNLGTLEIVGGGVGEITVEWSWRGLLSNPVQVSIRNVTLHLRPPGAAAAITVQEATSDEDSISRRFGQKLMCTLCLSVENATMVFEGVGHERLEVQFDRFTVWPRDQEELVDFQNLTLLVTDAENRRKQILEPLTPSVLVTRRGGRTLEDLLGLDVKIDASRPVITLDEQQLSCLVACAMLLRAEKRSNPTEQVASHMLAVATEAEPAESSWIGGAWARLGSWFSASSCDEEPTAKSGTIEGITVDDQAALLKDDAPLGVAATFNLALSVSGGSVALFDQIRCCSCLQVLLTGSANEPWVAELGMATLMVEDLSGDVATPPFEVVAFEDTIHSVMVTGSLDMSRMEVEVAALTVTLEPVACQVLIIIFGILSQALQDVRALPSHPAIKLHVQRLCAKLSFDSAATFTVSTVVGTAGRTSDGTREVTISTKALQVCASMDPVVVIPGLKVVGDEGVWLVNDVPVLIAAEQLQEVHQLRDPLFAWIQGCLNRVGPNWPKLVPSWRVPSWSLQVVDGSGPTRGVDLLLSGMAQGDSNSGSLEVAAFLHGESVLETCKLRWDNNEMKADPLVFAIPATSLRALRLLAEALQGVAPKGNISRLLPLPELCLDRAAVQISFPAGLQLRVNLTRCRVALDSLCVGHADLELTDGRSGVHAAIDGSIKADFSATKQVQAQGSFTVRDLAAGTDAVKCPRLDMRFTIDEEKAWHPGARVRFRNMKQKSFEGLAGSMQGLVGWIVAWDEPTSKWVVRIDGQESTVAVMKERLALCAQSVTCNVSLQSMEAKVTDAFLNSIDDHLAVAQEALREMSLCNVVFHERPLGLRTSRGHITAVSGRARIAGVRPGGHVVAVGDLREGSVNLARCSLPVALLLKPPSLQVEASCHISAFTLEAARIGVATQRATVHFPAQEQQRWGPGPASSFLQELRHRYTKMLLTQSPLLLANLAEDIGRDPVHGSIATGISLAQAAVTGMSIAVRRQQAKKRERVTPVLDFDDTCHSDVVFEEPAFHQPVTAAADAGALAAAGMNAGVAAGRQAAAGISRFVAQGARPREAPTFHQPAAAASDTVHLATAGVEAGLQVAGGITRLLAQGAQRSSGPGKGRGKGRGMGSTGDCKQQ